MHQEPSGLLVTRLKNMSCEDYFGASPFGSARRVVRKSVASAALLSFGCAYATQGSHFTVIALRFFTRIPQITA